MRKLGKNLKVGDTIEVWWSPTNGKANQDTITRLEKYNGSLAYLWPKGAKLAYFLYNKTGMTIDNSDYFTIVQT